MERKTLVNEIARFCFDYGLFDKSVKIDEIENKIKAELEDPSFIESLINTILVKTKYFKNSKSKNLDVDQLKELLLNLEKIRLELEYDRR